MEGAEPKRRRRVIWLLTETLHMEPVHSGGLEVWRNLP